MKGAMMRITDELLAAHMCGWDQVTLASDTTTGAKAVTARSLSRRQVLGGFGALTAAALLTACTQSQPPAPDAGGTPATGGAPAVNPSVTPAKLGNVTNGIDEVQVWQEEFYKDLHRHPDLWGEERRTAGKVTAKLQEIGADEVLQIGGGVVGIFRNGDGRRVLFRADMDALPVTEATNLDYASQEPGKMHACGHDTHVAAGLAAAALLARNKSEWAGTYLALFQPGEETGKGAQAMVDDGLVTKLAANKPDVCLAQHVLNVPASGQVATRSGPVLSAGDSLKVTVFGKGTHGALPHLGVDPAVLASSIVMRLQGIVAREIAPSDFGVVTVGAMKVGTAPNVISDQAELLLNVRAYDLAVRDKLLQGHRQDRPRRVPSLRLAEGAHVRDHRIVPAHHKRRTGHRRRDKGLHTGVRRRAGAPASPDSGLRGLQRHSHCLRRALHVLGPRRLPAGRADRCEPQPDLRASDPADAADRHRSGHRRDTGIRR